MPGFEHHVSVPFSRAVPCPYTGRLAVAAGPVARQVQEGGAPGA